MPNVPYTGPSPSRERWGQEALLPAQNMEHVRLKAQARDWLAFSQGEPNSGAGDRLAYQLVRAVLDGLPL